MKAPYSRAALLAFSLALFASGASVAHAACSTATYDHGPYECAQGGYGDCFVSSEVDWNDPGVGQYSAISASPTSIYRGEGTTLSWSFDVGSTNSSSCNYGGDPYGPYPIGSCTVTGLGQVGAMGYYWGPSQGGGTYGTYGDSGSGSAWVAPAQTTTYTITCSGYSIGWWYGWTGDSNNFFDVHWDYNPVVSQHSVTVTVSDPPSCQSSPNACGQVNYGTVLNGSCTASTPANPLYYGQSCSRTSSPNACGQTSTAYGAYGCSGSCSASTPSVPANPGNYGQSCSATSAANACGQRNTTYGTYGCSGSCSASTPSAPANPANYGASCTVTSPANSCGMTSTASGTYGCSGSCSASVPAAPSNSLCNQPPNVPSISYLYDNQGSVPYIGASGDAYHASGYRVYMNATDPNGDNVAIYYQLYNAQNGQTFAENWSENPTWVGSGGWTYTTNFANFSPGTYYVRAYAYDTSGATSAWSAWQPLALATPGITGSCSASPASVYEGQSATWSVSGVSGGNGSYAYSWSGTDGLSGSGASVSKSYAAAGAKTASVTISSAGLQTAVNCNADANPGDGTVNVISCNPTLSANPSTIDLGQTTDLAWSVPAACASSCQFSDGHSGGRSGTYTVTPPAPTSGTTDLYAVTCPANSSHVAQTSVTVRVPTASLSADPTRVRSGSSSTISWSASDVTSCSITRNGAAWKSSLAANGAGQVSGSSADTIATQTAYVIDCVDESGGGATAQASVVVNVVPDFTEF
jgi:hypothetical protein